jgi:predicted RNA-binding Zn ribbon-like protein
MNATATQPGERLPAPYPLSLVQDFVNTNDIEADREDLVKPDDLEEFLKARRLVPKAIRISPADLERAREIREAIRALLLTNTGEPLDVRAVDTLNEAAADLRLTVRFDESGSAFLEPDAEGVSVALAGLMGIVFGAMADGTWTRLKACSRHTCQWAFYDNSKNGSSRWCSMKICGNREKAKAYRQRHDRV